MTQPEFNVQAKFHMYKEEETMVKSWKKMARANASKPTFLEGILLKCVDNQCKYYIKKSIQVEYISNTPFFQFLIQLL